MGMQTSAVTMVEHGYSQNTEIELLYALAVSFLSIYPKYKH